MFEKRKIITFLNKLNLDEADYKVIKKHIHNLVEGTMFYMTRIEVGQKLYRARVCSEIPTKIKDMASPPDWKINDFQRCNPPNRAIFYCSSCTHSAVREIGASAGDKVYISEWVVKEEFYAVSITTNEDKTIPDGNSYPISVFFETKFLQPIHQTFSSQYKITSAIFEELTGNYIPPIDKNLTNDPIIKKGIHSLVYPSTANHNKSDCIAIEPKFAQSHLAINFVEERDITAINTDNIEYTFKKRSYIFYDSKIEWAKDGQVLCGCEEHRKDFYETYNEG